ncbi:hypothetical protein AB1Y20_004712 [Prymnesium parvum]|uniref:Uncharacterized protein n=1 Tax=Prymnesium parvum TaxID=97485 RepID=A0AB34IXE7_PRYPA
MSLGTASRLLLGVNSSSRSADSTNMAAYARFDSQRSSSQCSHGSREESSQSATSKQPSASRTSYHQRPPLFAKEVAAPSYDPSRLHALHLQCTEQSETIARMEARINMLADAVQGLTDENQRLEAEVKECRAAHASDLSTMPDRVRGILCDLLPSSSRGPHHRIGATGTSSIGLSTNALFSPPARELKTHAVVPRRFVGCLLSIADVPSPPPRISSCRQDPPSTPACTRWLIRLLLSIRTTLQTPHRTRRLFSNAAPPAYNAHTRSSFSEGSSHGSQPKRQRTPSPEHYPPPERTSPHCHDEGDAVLDEAEAIDLFEDQPGGAHLPPPLPDVVITPHFPSGGWWKRAYAPTHLESRRYQLGTSERTRHLTELGMVHPTL